MLRIVGERSARAKLEAHITLQYVHRPSHINIYIYIYIYIYIQKNRPVEMTRRACSARQLLHASGECNIYSIQVASMDRSLRVIICTFFMISLYFIDRINLSCL